MAKQRLKVLITVKTAPIPSKKYDELVCTAGVLEDGTFVRLYPINFRELDYYQQYRKYQWVELDVEKHTGLDARKESYRPAGPLALGERIDTRGDPTWSRRAEFVLPKRATSMEELVRLQAEDNTSLGLVKPKVVHDLKYTPDDPNWKESFANALKQQRLWENRDVTKEQLPRKLPWKFRYVFECDDPLCRGHEMMNEDWELHEFYWRMIGEGSEPEQAAAKTRERFLKVLCAPTKDACFFVGTVLAYKTWVVIGVWWPAKPKPNQQKRIAFS